MAICQNTIQELNKEFSRSQEIFIKDQKQRHPNQDADAWKILEVASMGTLSKLYKNLKHQLPEKANIANEMGLNLHSELSSWLEAITYVRNVIAHHFTEPPETSTLVLDHNDRKYNKELFELLANKNDRYIYYF